MHGLLITAFWIDTQSLDSCLPIPFHKACLSSSLSILEIINFSGDCKGKINGNHERWGALCGLIRFLILRFGFV